MHTELLIVPYCILQDKVLLKKPCFHGTGINFEVYLYREMQRKLLITHLCWRKKRYSLALFSSSGWQNCHDFHQANTEKRGNVNARFFGFQGYLNKFNDLSHQNSKQRIKTVFTENTQSHLYQKRIIGAVQDENDATVSNLKMVLFFEKSKLSSRLSALC